MRPAIVLAVPMAKGDSPLLAIGTKMEARANTVWFLMVMVDIHEGDLARLLGLFILDQAEQVLRPGFMPRLPPTVHFLENGQYRTARGHVLAPWVIDEADRLAARLEGEHRNYLSSFKAALRQEETGGFRKVPPGLVFADTMPSSRVGPPPPAIEVDLSRSERVSRSLRWEDVARLDYQRNRYLSDLTEAQLGRRVEDIIGNCHIINSQGLIGLSTEDPVLSYWMRCLVDAEMEMHLRHGPYPAGWETLGINPRRMPSSIELAGERGAVDFVTRRGLQGNYLIKYGKTEYLRKAISDGELRISPAASYDDPSLNQAIKDDELSTEILHDPRVLFNDEPIGTVVLPVQVRHIRAGINTNYLVSCLSETLTRRLFLDFEADCCLVVHDRRTFLDKLAAAMKEVRPEWKMIHGAVSYYDPVQVAPTEVQLPMSKHFRFAYQTEYRVAWLPPSPVGKLEPVVIRLEGLSEIAELVEAYEQGREAGA